MRLVHEPVENRVAKRGVADELVPVVDRELAGDPGRAPAGAVLEHLEQVAAFPIPQRREPRVVQQDQVRFRERLQEFVERSFARRLAQIRNQLCSSQTPLRFLMNRRVCSTLLPISSSRHGCIA